MTRVAICEARVGQRTDYDRLISSLDRWTHQPDDALTQARHSQHHLDVFVGYDKNAVELEEAEKQDDDK